MQLTFYNTGKNPYQEYDAPVCSNHQAKALLRRGIFERLTLVFSSNKAINNSSA